MKEAQIRETDFFMPYFVGTSWGPITQLIRAGLAMSLVLVWSLLTTSVQASEATILAVTPVVDDASLYIDADIELNLTSELYSAVSRGIPLYFSLDLEIVAHRWWWLDKMIVKKQRTWRIIYNALTRQWRVSAGELSVPEASLEDALARIRQIRGWPVASLDGLDTETEYQGRVRLRLDTSRLARPFQIDALNSSAWSLATTWKNFTFSISASEQE